MSTDLLKKYSLCSKKEALCSIHFPKDEKSLEAAKRRIVFEELFDFSLAMSITKGKTRSTDGKVFKAVSTKPLESSLGFELTGAQKRVIAECQKDMSTTTPMNRLIQGDVGSGKTAVAAACMYVAAKNGFQSAIISAQEPTLNPELLAEATRQLCPDIAPDFAKFRRLEVFDENMGIFR